MNKITETVQQNAPFDKEIIKKYIKFPLNFDGLSYVWDSNYNTIAQKYQCISRENMEEFVNIVNDIWYDSFLPNFDDELDTEYYILDTKYMNIWLLDEQSIISIRGWGKFQYEKNGEEIYTEVGKFLTYCCNRGKFEVNLLK